VPRRPTDHRVRSSPVRSSLPEYLGGKTRIFGGYLGHFTAISGIFRLSSTWHLHPPCALALISGDECYSSLPAVWNFKRSHASHYIFLVLVPYSAPFPWRHAGSSPPGCSHSGFVQAQDAFLPIAICNHSLLSAQAFPDRGLFWQSWGITRGQLGLGRLFAKGGRGLDDSCLVSKEGRGDGICFSG